MAKASVVAAKQANAVASIDERMTKLEEQNAALVQEVAALRGAIAAGFVDLLNAMSGHTPMTAATEQSPTPPNQPPVPPQETKRGGR